MTASSRSTSARHRTNRSPFAYRLVATINEARLEVKESGTVHRRGCSFARKTTSSATSACIRKVRCSWTRQSQTLWEHYLAFYRKYGDTTLDFDQEESCRFMNRVFRQPALKRLHRQSRRE